jgi:hypothetical protein
LEVVGADGIPSVERGGNVLRPRTTLKLSLRIPPGVNGNDAKELLKQTIESSPPYGAKVSLEFPYPPSTGWHFANMTPALRDAMEQASKEVFDRPVGFMLQGVSIPFVNMFANLFPNAQFIVAGVLGYALASRFPATHLLNILLTLQSYFITDLVAMPMDRMRAWTSSISKSSPPRSSALFSNSRSKETSNTLIRLIMYVHKYSRVFPVSLLVI